MWSVKAVVESVVEHGRRALHLQLRRRQPHHQQQQQRLHQQLSGHKLSKGAREGAGEAAAEGCSGVSRAGLVASRLRPFTAQLVEGICRRVPAPLWTEARRRTTQRLVFGASAPYFALVGVTLVGGGPHGLVTRDDELESLCGIVREAISRSGWLHNPEFWQLQHKEGSQQEQRQAEERKEVQEEQKGKGGKEHVYSLADFTLGHAIDKGCNAVVYAARWKTDESYVNTLPHEDEEQGMGSSSISPTIREVVEGLPYPQEQVNGCETCTLGDSVLAASFLQLQGQTENGEAELALDEQEEVQIPLGSQGAVARISTTPSGSSEDGQLGEGMKTKKEEATKAELQEYPLAIKMMFNYEAESNASAILRAMYKEILPAQNVQLDHAQQEWLERLWGPRVCLPPHPNIVEMPCVFVDRVPLLEGCLDLYPQALPTRLNPHGYGRNMSLFCVMKRYDTSLREYLSHHSPSQHTCLLLLTQLFEALLHLSNNNIAHRDLKSDNILLSLAEGWQYPLLVVTDFGCSLVGDSTSLTVPFPSREADPRQGNPALMAPEVKTAMPGLLSSVSFRQSDIWASGTLVYEIYGLDNPFCPSVTPNTSSPRRPKQLDSATYKESQLPRLPRSAPPWVRHLVSDILRRNPRVRPTINIAATLCQLMMWAPSRWLSRHSLSLPSHTEVTQWLLCLATKVLCEARLPSAHTHQQGKRTVGFEDSADHQGSQLEYQMVSTFLGRVHYVDIIQAIKWNRAF